MLAIGLILCLVGFVGFRSTQIPWPMSLWFQPRGWTWNDTWVVVWALGLFLMVASVVVFAWRHMP